MKIREETRYITSDGREWEDLAWAEAQEKRLEALKKVSDWEVALANKVAIPGRTMALVAPYVTSLAIFMATGELEFRNDD